MGNFCNCGSEGCGNDISISIAFDELLLSKDYYTFLWRFYKQQDLSQRKMRELIIDTLCRLCCIEVRDEKGYVFDIPEYDDVLPQDECCTWFRRYLKLDDRACEPNTYYDSQEYIMRLRLLDIVAKLIDPKYFR